jgi:hypothetical protein
MTAVVPSALDHDRVEVTHVAFVAHRLFECCRNFELQINSDLQDFC